MASEPPPLDDIYQNQDQIQTKVEDPPVQNDWEKAWPIDRIRKEAPVWSLAGDSALLYSLKEFSQKMIAKTHEMEKDVASVSHLTKTMGVGVQNVFNDFIMLSNSQFVENRVYDEDVSQADAEEETKPDNQEKTREQREANLVPLISEALKHGIDIISDYFDTLDVGVMDSESEGDEEIPYRADPILEAKDPYVGRPLPHIIGSHEFLNEDDVGLLEPPSDVEEETHGSMSESEESGDSEYSESDDEKEEKAAKTIHSSSSYSGLESSTEGEEKDLFGGEDASSNGTESSSEGEEGEEGGQQQKPKVGVTDFASELAAKIGATIAPVTKDNDDSDEADDVKKQEPKIDGTQTKQDRSESRASHKKDKSHKHRSSRTEKKVDEPDPFVADDAENDSPFFANKGGGLFSGGTSSLFDDIPESNGLFDDSNKESKDTKTAPQPTNQDTRQRKVSGRRSSHRKQSSVESDDSSDLFTAKPPPKLKTQPSATSGIFGDDEDDEDGDIFSSPAKRVAESRNKSRSSTQDLFDESQEPAVDDVTSTAPKKKLPAGAVSIFGGGSDPMTAAIRQRQQSMTESDHDNDSQTPMSHSARHQSNKDPLPTIASSSNLHVKSADMPTSASSSSLFASEPIDDSLFVEKTTEKISSKPRLFDAEENNDSLFSPKATTKTTSDKKSKGFLFDDDDDADTDIFAGLSAPADTPRKKSSTSSAALFRADEPSRAMPDATKEDTKQTALPAAGKRAGKTQISLFDEDDNNDDDDLFGISNSAKPKPKVVEEAPKPAPEKSRTKSLFDDDDDDLFRTPDANPTVDLFGSAPSPTTQEKPKSTTSLFNDEDNDDLFNTTPDTNRRGNLFGSAPQIERPLAHDKEVQKPSTQVKEVQKPLTQVKEVQKTSTQVKEVQKTSAQVKEVQKTSTQVKEIQKTSDQGPKVQKSASLFDDFSDDSLFDSVKKPAPETRHIGSSESETIKSTQEKEAEPLPSTQSESESVLPKKKLAGAVPLLGGVDLFAAPESGRGSNRDDKDLFSATPKSATKPTDELPSKPRPPKTPKPPKNPRSFSESSEDDLFKPTITTHPVPQASSKLTDDPTGGLFPSISAASDNLEKAASTHKPKIPTGAVSMFTGSDPTIPAKVRSTQGSAVIGEASLSPERATGGDVANRASRVADIQNRLSFDPSALLPGASPPVRKSETEAASFERPAQVETLVSATKTRARIQQKRRPPSRVLRKTSSLETDQTPPPYLTPSPLASPTDLFSTSHLPFLGPILDQKPAPIQKQTPTSTFSLPAATKSFKPVQFNPALTKVAQNKTESAVDTFEATKNDAVGNIAVDNYAKNSNVDSSLFNKDVKKTPNEAKPKSNLTSDIFISGSMLGENGDEITPVLRTDANLGNDIFTARSFKKTSTNDVSDLFSSLTDKNSVHEAEAKEKRDISSTANLLDAHSHRTTDAKNEEDDLFSSALIKKDGREVDEVVKSIAAKERAVENGSGTLSAVNSVEANNASSSTQKVPPQAPTDDDIFADVAVADVAPKKTRRPKAKTKDEFLFPDDTDIFADLPPATTKERKKKKTSEKKSTVKHNTDDIFAEATSQPKAKKTSKRNTPKATPVIDDIFADNSLQFDDPLGLLGK